VAWGPVKPLQKPKIVIRGRKIQIPMKTARIYTKYWKKPDSSHNPQKTTFLDCNVTFSICKNPNSSAFSGENFRKTIKGTFHS